MLHNVNRSLAGLVIKFVLLPALGFVGFQAFWPGHAPQESPRAERGGDAEPTITAQVELDQMVVAVKLYLQTGSPEERHYFGHRLTRFRDVLQRLETSAQSPESRRLMAGLKDHVDHLVALGSEFVGVANPTLQPVASGKLTQFATLRDRTVLTMVEIRSAEIRHAHREGDPISDLVRSSGLVAVATLALSAVVAVGVGHLISSA